MILLRTNAFNRDNTRFMERLAGYREGSKEYLFNGDSAELTNSLERIRDFYSVADALAIHFQRLTIRVRMSLFFLILVAVSFFYMYSNLFYPKSFLLLYVLTLSVTSYCYWLVKRGDYEGKFLDYRALAEGLRVQFFWKLAGLNRPVADIYLQKQKSELDWIRKALGALVVLTEDDEQEPDPVASNRNRFLILTDWVDGQRRFFAYAAKRDIRKLKWQRRLVRLSVLSSLVLATVQIIQDRSDPLIFLMGLMLLVAGSLASYIENRKLSEQIKRYRKMGALFATAEQRLKDLLKGGEYAQASDLVEELGKEVLRENGDWVMLRREQVMEVPTPY